MDLMLNFTNLAATFPHSPSRANGKVHQIYTDQTARSVTWQMGSVASALCRRNGDNVDEASDGEDSIHSEYNAT